MKFKSHLLAQASGSVAGATYSHNKGGMYIRSRSIPINPASSYQQSVRSALKTLTTRWANTLTSAQRAAWAVYAANVPILNKLGEPRPIPALSMYVRCNSPRLYVEGPAAIVDDGPTVYSLATFSPITASYASPTLTINYTNTDDWAIATGGYLFLYASQQQNPTILFFKGPFRFQADVQGNTMTPPTSPTTTVLPLPIATDNQIYLRAQVSNADGRLSSSQVISVSN